MGEEEDIEYGLSIVDCRLSIIDYRLSSGLPLFLDFIDAGRGAS